MMLADDISGNDTTGGMGLLAKWRAKRIERKREKANEYLEETAPPKEERGIIGTILAFVMENWLWIAIGGGIYLAWKFLFKRRGFGYRRKKKVNSGRAFYLRMKRAKERKRKK